MERRIRILLVEDEQVLRRLVAQYLRLEDYEVEEAADGLEAVEQYVRSGPFELVLLDLNLPGLPGVEVCRRIKAVHPAQPVLICSASILPGHESMLRQMGVEQFLSKPFQPALLRSHIESSLKLPVAKGHWTRSARVGLH